MNPKAEVGAMLCPQCQAPMIVYELDGVELDVCRACGGTWLDRGELETLCDLARIEPGPLLLGLTRAPEGSVRKGDRKCPRCRRKLVEITLAGARPWVLDRCPAGEGYWFDKGELGGVLAAECADEAERAAVAGLLGEMFKAGGTR